jgi:hypothetical protein
MQQRKQASLLGKAKQTGDTARLQVNILNSSITQAPKSNLKFVIQQNTACFYIPAAKQTQHSFDSILLVAETNGTLLTLSPYPANLPIVVKKKSMPNKKKKNSPVCSWKRLSRV